eukprot:jgi/Bigna1/61128/fgenesh1_kg.18_\
MLYKDIERAIGNSKERYVPSDSPNLLQVKRALRCNVAEQKAYFECSCTTKENLDELLEVLARRIAKISHRKEQTAKISHRKEQTARSCRLF